MSVICNRSDDNKRYIEMIKLCKSIFKQNYRMGVTAFHYYYCVAQIVIKNRVDMSVNPGN